MFAFFAQMKDLHNLYLFAWGEIEYIFYANKIFELERIFDYILISNDLSYVTRKIAYQIEMQIFVENLISSFAW